ncbi:MAG: ribonuclease HI [Clostridia bacterium]|nr:ribonuclease HI [Clostridia bacterium]
MKHIYLYTDGSCKCNPGPGGWCAILVYNGHEKLLCGGESQTTNNRMELTAIIEGLKALKESCRVTLTSDSKYALDALQNGWAESWKERGWRKADRSQALNPDLWEILLNEVKKHDIEYVWVKGHAGHPYNERCDKAAQSEADKYAI